MKNILSTLVITFAFAGYAFGVCNEADKKALEAYDRAWGMAGEKGDRAALAAIYADDYAGLPDMQNKAQTIESAMADFERVRANPSLADKISHDNYKITCTPNSAVITHRNVITTNNALGKEVASWTHSVHFLEKRGGKWQVVGNSGNNFDESAIVGYMARDWMGAQILSDVSWAERNLAADFSGIDTGGGYIGKTGLLTEYKARAGKPGPSTSEVSQLNVRVEGDTAIATGIASFKGQDGNGQPVELRARFTDTYIKRDGRWQLWASQGTRIP